MFPVRAFCSIPRILYTSPEIDSLESVSDDSKTRESRTRTAACVSGFETTGEYRYDTLIIH